MYNVCVHVRINLVMTIIHVYESNHCLAVYLESCHRSHVCDTLSRFQIHPKVR